MCIEFPETDLQLQSWARWIRTTGMTSELGYSRSSSHENLPGGSFCEIPDNPDAERVDRLVSELSVKYNDIYKILRSHYVYGDNSREGSRYQHIGIGKYQAYLKIGIAWVDRGLYENP